MKFKTLAMAVSVLLGTAAYAGDNTIYIDQSGSNTVVSMTQDGSSNSVVGIGTGNRTPAVIYGDSNSVTVNQIGNGNMLQLGVQTQVARGVDTGNTFNYAVNGNNDMAVINSNADNSSVSAGNSIRVTETGSFDLYNAYVTGHVNMLNSTVQGGDHNNIVDVVNGDNNSQTINVNGGGNNSVVINQGMNSSGLASVGALNSGSGVTSNMNGVIALSVMGASNTVDISQTGGNGLVGHNATLSLDGSGNYANISQQGTSAASLVSITSVGNNNTFAVSSNTH